MNTIDSTQQETKCDRPPEGWECTRKSGHEGPCAAIPILSTVESLDNEFYVHALHSEATLRRGLESIIGMCDARGSDEILDQISEFCHELLDGKGLRSTNFVMKLDLSRLLQSLPDDVRKKVSLFDLDRTVNAYNQPAFTSSN